MSLQLLDLFRKAGTALPSGEIDVAARTGRSPRLAVLCLELRFVYFAVSDQMGVVEVVGICTHVEVFFAVFNVSLTNEGS